MKPIDPTSLDQARDTLRKHLPLEVVREQLAAVEEELAQRDARIEELERAVHERAKSLAERTRQVAKLQDELTDARNARDKAQSELAALKSAPVRFEREVDAELRAAISNHAHWADPTNWNNDAAKRAASALKAWLAAPLSAPDEYTRAAVAYAETWIDESLSATAMTEAENAWIAAWTARHSAAASAPDVKKAAPAIEESTFDSKAVAPAPADGERVTVYVKLFANGESGAAIWSQSEMERHTLAPGEKWLALDARVVREGGGK